MQTALCETPVLRVPDFSKLFVVELNALDQAVGAVMLQPYESKLLPVAYFSMKYLTAEKNYPAHEKKLLAIFNACMNRRCYLDGHPTIVYNDNKLLVNLSIQPHLSKW